MKSKNSAGMLDLARDLPTTEEDVSALRQLRYSPPVSLESYLNFLDRVGSASVEQLRAKKGPQGRPFELPSALLE